MSIWKFTWSSSKLFLWKDYRCDLLRSTLSDSENVDQEDHHIWSDLLSSLKVAKGNMILKYGKKYFFLESNHKAENKNSFMW